jgi:hypothetical protein
LRKENEMNTKDDNGLEESGQPEPETDEVMGDIESPEAAESRFSEMAKKVGESTSAGYKKARPVVVAGAKKGAHIAAVGGRKGAHLAVLGAGKAKDLVMGFWQKATESDGPDSEDDDQ